MKSIYVFNLSPSDNAAGFIEFEEKKKKRQKAQVILLTFFFPLSESSGCFGSTLKHQTAEGGGGKKEGRGSGPLVSCCCNFLFLPHTYGDNRETGKKKKDRTTYMGEREAMKASNVTGQATRGK